MTDPSGKDHDDDLKRALQGVVPEAGAPIIEEEILIEIDAPGRERKSDEQILARFFGICVIMIGLITILPSIYYLVVLATADAGQAVPRWAYFIGFLGAVHLLYGIYIWQLLDYSAMQMLSAFMLIATCLYGFTGMALMLDEGDSAVATFLQLPEVLKQRAMIWCGIMFGITALACYLFGREAMSWHRRSLLKSKSTANGSP